MQTKVIIFMQPGTGRLKKTLMKENYEERLVGRNGQAEEGGIVGKIETYKWLSV